MHNACAAASHSVRRRTQARDGKTPWTLGITNTLGITKDYTIYECVSHAQNPINVYKPLKNIFYIALYV